MSNSRTRSISRSYRSRVAAVGGAITAPETAPAEERPAPPEKADDLPKESWKKGDIIDWLIDNGVVLKRSDIEEQTKAELIENFIGD